MVSDEFFRTICEQTFDEIWVTDRNGITLYVNPSCEQIYGAKLSELVGKDVRELERQGYFRPAIAPIVVARKQRLTMRQETRTGKVMLVTGTPIVDANGEVQYVVENSRDTSALEGMMHEFELAESLALRYRAELDSLEKELFMKRQAVIVGGGMTEVLRMSTLAAASDANVLITGESGTGKNLIARYIHKNSRRCSGPLVTVNCPSIPEQLLESELFGYRPGAFTGASRSGKPGLLQIADKGAAFFDEIGDLTLTAQSKVLQAIEEHKFTPIGATKSVTSDFRVISATNQNIRELVESGRFRLDLFYRMNVINIRIPPLRERPGDIPELVAYFLDGLNGAGRTRLSISEDAVKTLSGYHWPGNVRELEHLLESLAVMNPSATISTSDLPQDLRKPRFTEQAKTGTLAGPLNRDRLVQLYDELGSTYKVAKACSISQSKVYRLIGDYIKAR